MAEVRLQQIRHSYNANAGEKTEYALQKIDQVWEDGGAYALLGPSGCGKSTLLNIVSGLLQPTEGKVFFDNIDVTLSTPDQRNIAQIFQFPVVYDTMTVYDNLAFPLRNRKIANSEIEERVKSVSNMLDLTSLLNQRASGLSADGKQKISLGRGLVRSDVNIMMFDEPLTVIDPHLKWKLRTELKKLHRQIGFTMVYVTHDQTEALTFAEKVAVMFEGKVVQFGTPEELFLKPNHTFVGHFIGSPGMNLLPCQIDDGCPIFQGNRIKLEGQILQPDSTKIIELGVRPEFIKIDSKGFPVKINRIEDVGRYQILKVESSGHKFNVFVPEDFEIPTENLRVSFDPKYTHVYCDGWLYKERESV